MKTIHSFKGEAMNTEQIAYIIRELSNKTVERGCSEAEAMAAANKVGQLLQQYNLSLSEVFIEQSECITAVIETGRERRHPIDNCVVGIATFCDCKVWRGSGKYNFFGMEADTQMAKYLYKTIFIAMDNETEKFKQSYEYRASTRRKMASTSFQKGMAARIYHRLIALHNERRGEELRLQQSNTAGTSLVIVKDNKVEGEYNKLAISLGLRKATVTKTRYNISAFALGQQAGDRVSLNRPIAGNSERVAAIAY